MNVEKKRKKTDWLIVVFLLLIAAVLPLFLTQQVRATHQYLINEPYSFEELSETEIVQEFTPEYRYLYSIELLPILIGPETDGEIRIRIENPSGRTVCDKTFQASGIAAGDFVVFELNAWLKKGETHRLFLSYDGTAAEPPRVMVSEKKNNLYETGDMYVGGSLSDWNMAVTYHYR